MEDVLAYREHLDLAPHLPLLHADAALRILQQLLPYYLRLRPQYLIEEEYRLWLALFSPIFFYGARLICLLSRGFICLLFFIISRGCSFRLLGL